MSADLPARTAPVSQQMTLRDEEITDVSLATFQVFDKENMQRPRARLACGGACGSSFLLQPARIRRACVLEQIPPFHERT